MLKVLLLFLITVLSLYGELIILKPSVPPKDYTLIWNDEFSGNQLDMSKWSHRWLGKRKLGYTTEDSIRIDNGTLKIITYKEGNRYCSGMIATARKFEATYGYYEVRAKVPKIKGIQSAFWLMSSEYGKTLDNSGYSGMEIDIMEYVKTSPGQLHFSTHWDGYGIFHKKNIFSIKYPKIEDGNWHTFGLLWTPKSYKFYVDGAFMHEKADAISQTNQYIKLSSEVGPWGGGIESISKELLPDQFEIDYVRVYQKK